MNIFLPLSVFLLIGLVCIRFWYCIEARRLAISWQQLAASAEPAPALFDPAMVANLPSPARRFFLFSIKPGTPLRRVVQIWMSGDLGLGTQAKPNYQPMTGHQLLAAPKGSIWKACMGDALSTVYGSDGFVNGYSWTKFWLFACLPIVRSFGRRDHARSAFGRMVAEAIFWSPAALLPQTGVHWQAIGEDHARATVTFEGFSQSIDITIATDGQPLCVWFLRWSNANPKKTYQLQVFGGYLSNFEIFEGFHLPTHVEAGNFFGSEDYFPFYRAEIEGIRFVQKTENSKSTD
jgi:hypothetical protein